MKWEPAAVYDTLDFAYQLYPDAGSYKLADLLRFVFGRDHESAHRGYTPDAQATADLFINLTDGLPQRLDAVRRDVGDREIRRGRDGYNRSGAGSAHRGHPAPQQGSARA